MGPNHLTIALDLSQLGSPETVKRGNCRNQARRLQLTDLSCLPIGHETLAISDSVLGRTHSDPHTRGCMCTLSLCRARSALCRSIAPTCKYMSTGMEGENQTSRV
jgi:hypothetical protein